MFRAVLLACVFMMPVDDVLFAQVTSLPTPTEVKRLLNEYEISETEFRTALQSRGYDLNNIDVSTVDLQELERVSIEVINELSDEKARIEAEQDQAVQEKVDSSVAKVTAETSEAIEEAIDQGASTEEAVSEQIQNLASQSLPDASIFGHNLFRNKDVTVFRQADKIKPPKTYVLGVGDELSITINGLSQASITTTVNEEGYITIDDGGRKPSIPISGLTLEQAEELLKRRLKAFYNYNDNQFYLTVLTARTVTVNFFGEVITTGGITLSAVNTLFNALVAAGGPTDLGSVRRIRLISGAENKVFDTYKFMDNPSLAEEFYLKNNDYIHIPVAERVVSISGAVRRPFKYELLEDEHLVKLIDYAGGVLNDAYLGDIQITRYNRDQRVVVNVNLRDIMDSGGDYLLQPGDEIFIRSIDTEVENVVTIRGAVELEGEYERQDGMRVSQLIDKARLDRDALLDYGYLLRQNPDGRYTYNRFRPLGALENRGGDDDLLLQDLDIIQIPSSVSYSDEVGFVVSGAIRSPGRYDFDPAGVLRVQDAILLSGGLRPSASDFGYILRKDPEEPKRADYIVFNPKVAMEDIASADNRILMPYDSLVIYDEYDLRDNFFIEVRGAVRSPGIFPFDPGLNLQQALDLAGGLTFSAATNRVDVARVIINENQPTRTVSITTTVSREHGAGISDTGMVLFPFDEIFVRDVPEFELQQNVVLEGEVAYPGVYATLEENERIASLINRAGGLTSEAFPGGATLLRSFEDIGYVVIDLESALRNPSSTLNLIVRDGDVITIPKQPDLVTIQGAVNLRDLYPADYLASGNRINVGYIKGKSAKYYIDNYAAGLAEDGRKRLITVKQANGKVEKTKNFLFFKVYPKVEKGATVSVGRVEPKPDPLPGEKEEIDWGRVVSTTLAQATAVLTLVLLIERI